MVHRLPLLVLFLLFMALPAGAAGWQRHENRDLIQGARAGWVLETPSEWVTIPDVQPPPPLGLGYRSESGDAGVIVTFLDRLPGGELEALVTRGYQESPGRVAGHDVKVFTRSADGKTRRVAYLQVPAGTYRVMLFGPSDGEETLDKVLRTFQLVTGLSPTGPEQWTTWTSPEGGFGLSHPADWSARAAGGGTELVGPDGKVAVMITLRKGGSEGQSFRGLARTLGSQTIPGATHLERFEPVVTEVGVTGYLAVWKTGEDRLVGPVAYLPLAAGTTGQAVEALLADPAQSDTFFRIVRSFHAGGGNGRP